MRRTLMSTPRRIRPARIPRMMPISVLEKLAFWSWSAPAAGGGDRVGTGTGPVTRPPLRENRPVCESAVTFGVKLPASESEAAF
jgi:hypothetical protein